MSVNKVILVGNVGQDPEVKHLEGGNTVANFSLATSETYKNKQGEKVTDTEWHRIVCYGKLAEIVEKWVKKGQQLYLEGQNKTRSWEDKDGNKKYTTEIIIGFNGTLQMIGKKSDNEPTNQSNTIQPEDPADKDLPF